MDSTKADLLIVGSSRASHHYQPVIFQNSLNLTCYNAGRDGEFLLYDYAILKAVLKRHSPRMIILDIVPGEFAKSNNSYDRLSALLPYYKKHPEIRSIIELRSNFEKLKLLSNIYPYNSSILNIMSQNIILPPENKENSNGYLPLNKIWEESIKNDNNPIKYEIDGTMIKIYKSFIEDCIKSKVALYIICSPYFKKYPHTDYSIKLAHEIAGNFNVKFFDYLEDSTFINHSRLFDDPAHLNNQGAKVFSVKVADCIRADYNRGRSARN